MSAPSTSTKIAPVMPRISQNASTIRPAFGDCGPTGEIPPFDASAPPAGASAPAATSRQADNLRRTGAGILRAVAEQARVELPAYVQGEFEVFVNGVPQVAGRDFHREGGWLVFDRALAKEGRLGTMRWLSMLLGIAGT